MLRFLFALALLGAVLLVRVDAQVYTIQPRPITVNNKPRGGFSLSLRYGGAVNVTFEDVGAVGSLRDIGDTTSLRLRNYDDGFVGIDTRSGFGNSGDDGQTNTWAYLYDSQVTADGNIAFHKYATASNGTDVQAESGDSSGVDMQYDMVLGVGGAPVTERSWTYTWGLMAGGLFSPINAKARQQISANVVTITDLYSLNGASVPHAAPVDQNDDGTPDYVPGYTAPSTITIDGTSPTGVPVTYTIDNTTFLNNRPYFRSTPTVMADAATVDGYWQVKGAYYSFRAGPWARWQFSRYFSVRASLGASFSFLGVTMERDEFVSGIEVVTPLRAGAITTPDKNERWGLYGAIDLEWWLSDRTGFFVSATYEDTGDDVVLTSGDPANGGRRAVVELPNGTGFRAGISVLF